MTNLYYIRTVATYDGVQHHERFCCFRSIVCAFGAGLVWSWCAAKPRTTTTPGSFEGHCPSNSRLTEDVAIALLLICLSIVVFPPQT